jgi:hypothetical protein
MTTAALTNGTQVSGRCSRASQVRHHSVYEIVLRFPDILLLHWPRDCEEKKKKTGWRLYEMVSIASLSNQWMRGERFPQHRSQNVKMLEYETEFC